MASRHLSLLLVTEYFEFQRIRHGVVRTIEASGYEDATRQALRCLE